MAKDDLPRRDSAQSKAEQAKAEAAERDRHVQEGWSVGGRPGRESGGEWNPSREH